VSSNFERLMFDMFDRNPAEVGSAVTAFRKTGRMSVGGNQLADVKRLFDAARFDDDETRKFIRDTYEATGELLDPHSAIGAAAGRARRGDPSVPMIALATAHPAKFPDAVRAATGISPALPERLADLFDRPERYENLPNELAAVQSHIRGAIGLKEGAA
jgi:threonine synthase